jgi:diguanylate cyclase (GGDEF)-like protein
MAEAGNDLDRANRVLKMLSRINRTIVRAESPDGLYQDACRIAVESGLFVFAWVGLIDPHTDRMRLMYGAGDQRCPAEVLIAPDGFAHTTFQRGEMATHNTPNSLPESQGRDTFLTAGYYGLAALPLQEDGRTIGVLSLYTDRPDCFDKLVTDLLAEVADDLSFSLQHILNEQRRLAYETKLHYLAFYDAQTGMPNRALLEERLPLLAAKAERNGTFLTLLDIRLQRLDNIVQVHGRQSIDEVLRALALRLEQCRGTDGLLAQLAHDEFMLASLDLAQGSTIAPFAETVKQLIEQPVGFGDREIFVHAAIGGAMYQLHEHDLDYLMRRARAAAERSEDDGAFHVYEASHDHGLEQRVAMEAELHRALERNEFIVYYQPQIELKNGVMVGVEALLRWRHPRLGLVSPAHFIPLLEECGLMPSVGAWVLKTACRQAREWLDAGLPALRMAVNLSAQQFRSVDLVPRVREALNEARLDPDMLELELTESQILENAERTIEMMHELKSLGVRLSLDDFGTGYSSLGYLRRYPVDRIKIDQSFIRDMASHPGSTALVRSILAMADNLGLQTIAEGVETTAQTGYLRKQRCHEMQGFLFSRPVPPEDIVQMASEGRRLEIQDDTTDSTRTLLVVDDEPRVHAAIARALRGEGWKLLAAHDAASALELLARSDIGVIISEQRMKDMNGTELLRRVREMYPDTVRILLTGYTDYNAVVEAVNQGNLYKVLCKPIGDEHLRTNIREAFRRHEMFAENRRMAQQLGALENNLPASDTAGSS